MEARKVKENSRAVIVKKRKNNGSNDNNESVPVQYDKHAEHNMENKQKDKHKHGQSAKTVPVYQAKNFKVGHKKPMKQSIRLTNKGSNDRTKLEKSCKKYVSKQELPNSSILDSASVSQNASSGLCRFACLDCSSTFTNWFALQTHGKKVHDKLIYTHDLEAYMYKASVHICLICSMKILSDTQFLKNHFRRVHNIPLNKYRQQYNCNSVQNIQKTELNKRIEKAKHSKTVIGNFCTFKCPGCKRIFNNYSTFKQHISLIAGKCTQLQNNIQWRTCVLEVVSHKCKLCSKHLLCDNNVIMDHVKKYHDIKTILEYSKKTGSTLRNCRNIIDGSHILNSKKATISTEIGNYCTFTCHNCGFSSGNWPHLRKHLIKTHGTSDSEWHQHITKVVLHQCKICKKKVLNECKFVQNHVYRNHQMSISEYKKLEV